MPDDTNEVLDSIPTSDDMANIFDDLSGVGDEPGVDSKSTESEQDTGSDTDTGGEAGAAPGDEINNEQGHPAKTPEEPADSTQAPVTPQVVTPPSSLPPEVPTTPTTPTTPATPVAPPQQPVVPQPQQPVAQPQQPVPQQQSAQPAQPVQPVQPQAPEPLTTEQLTEVRENIRKQIESRYSIPDDEKDALLTEPESILPTLASRVMMDTYDAVMATVMQQLPQLVSSIQQQAQASKSLEQKFYERWPKLKNPEYGDTIRRIALTYRQLYPQATEKQLIDEIGAQASIVLGATPDTPQPVAPAATQQPKFTPAMPGGSSAPASPPEPNFYAKFAEETERLENG